MALAPRTRPTPLPPQPMSASKAVRATIGAVVGAAAWPVLRLVAPVLPFPVAFSIGWFLFTIGPGFAIGGRLTAGFDALRRIIILFGIGSAAAPVLIVLLGHAHA